MSIWRRYSTLDHLTGGRIGWNVVTGYLNSAAKGIRLARQSNSPTARAGRAGAISSEGSRGVASPASGSFAP